MSGTTTKLTAPVEEFFADLRRVRASGAATPERSLYGPLGDLLKTIGATLKPKVFCVQELADQGAGHPDFGLYAARQVQKGAPREGQAPERGVVEVKSPADDAWLTAAGSQASRYWGRYRLVLVTNARDFVLVGEDANGRPATLETLRLAGSEGDFLRRLEKPRAFADEAGARLGEYLARALSHRAALAEPKDLAWLLASYARDGLARVEAAGGAPQLAAVHSALEEALGIRFEGEQGRRFFRSTLVQTLFYGIFSAWVLWARTDAATPEPGRLFTGTPDATRFRWREAVWHLRAPVLRALFQQIADPGRLQPLGLTEVLDWTAAALDRVDRPAFFARFNEGEAVPYFYEPFLEAFDPDLRKQLGVWYTPSEVVRYMVARVDRTLKDDLGIADGLAAENVFVLDPCCGTGAYLAEVLRRIAANLDGRGLGALVGAGVKQAAMERVLGFEIMPAPFVVAHLQVGLTMQDLDAPLADNGTERAGVYLTNALTGWEARTNNPLPFPELEEERKHAGRVKRETPILVILGNPPYNGFAGVAVDEERELSDAYRTTKRVRRPEGQGLRTVIDIKLSTSSRDEFVIPVPVKRVGDQRDGIHLRLGHLHACGILTGIELGLDLKPGRRSRVADAVDDGLIGRQRGPAPVRRDVAKEPVLDLVPLARAGWEVTHLDGQAGLIGQMLKLMLPDTGPISIASARISRDVKDFGVRVSAPAHPLPPVTNRGHRKGRGVVVTPDAHPPFIAGHVVDPIGNRLALRVGREIMHEHRWRTPRRLPFPARIPEVPHQLLLLRVDRDHRLPGGQKPVRRRIDMLELRVAVRMRGAFPTFARRLQSVAQTVEQAAHRGRTHAPPLLGQRRRQFCATLARPAQGRGRVPPRERVHQRLQRRQNAGLVLLNPGASGARGSDTACRCFGAGDLPTSLANRLPSQAGGRRNQRVAAIANGQRLGRRPPSATALVQNGSHRDVFCDDCGFQFHVPLHADGMMTEKPRDSNLI